ncbi:MAG: sulfite exporter TauE/SafE family protein [Bacteroidota bacterium]
MIWSAFVLGFLGSLHCVGMCGPIAFMLPVSQTNSAKKAFQISLYHLGRILAYAIIGLFFGLIGEGFSAFGFQQNLSIVIGVLMILTILIPQPYLKSFKITLPIYRLIGKIKSAIGQSFKKKSLDTFFNLGFLNGFLPCGLVYIAVFAAIAMNQTWQGSLYMMMFGLGTIPLMTGVVYSKGIIQKFTKNKFKKIIPYVVVLMGILFILRGLGLGIPYLSPAEIQPKVTTNIECH